MGLLAGLTTFFLLLRYTSADLPPDFPGDETPYRVIPTGTVKPANLTGTYLYAYLECDKNFGPGAKGQIDDAVLVANVMNGPDYVVDKNWESVIDQAASQGKKILGYVRTGYLGVSQQQFTTRLGSRNLADWASQIEQDVDKWFQLYGSSLGGIFFDEGWPECGPNNTYADLYAYINNYTKRKHPGAYTVLNPGSTIAQCYEDTMDTLLTFEGSYETYTNSFVPNDWTPKDPRKIWHIVYNVTQEQVAGLAALARSRHSGLLEITDGDQPNPYDTLPSDAYMKAIIDEVSGGKPLINNPAKVTGSYVAGVPNNALVSSSDYSSVTLTWSSVENALGYAVYKNGIQVLELPASLTRATIGMLEPGSSGIAFEVRTILASSSGGSSRLISASTKSLPENGTITNAGFTQDGDNVVYTADILMPYASVRLYIGIDQDQSGAQPIHGWPIQQTGVDAQGTALSQVVNYLVEGNDYYSAFYKYTGSWNDQDKGNADWSWSSIGVAHQFQSGYTYTWNVSLAGTDAVASQYLIQGQGYAPTDSLCMGTLSTYD
ncbi:Fibronectin, type III [Penicillium italicum]|uniref:Fibronectin, type III n=1 Tax=Penicillium italicum TaxID=40296 RepID=A0A0A2LIF6_PENIT|nr:Fibronectin, type III [Penicillium italicum]